VGDDATITGSLVAADIDMAGDLDFDGDILILGTQTGDMNEWGADSITSSTTEYLLEIYDSTPIITGGTVTLAALNIDLGIGNSTGGINNIYGIAIDTISADAQNTETAIKVGGGWDLAADFGGAVDINGGLTDIGGGSCAVADGDNDLCVAADLEVDGELELDGALDADSTANFADTVTFSKGTGNAVVVSAGGTLNVDGVLDAVVGTEHLGMPSVISTAITYTAAAGGTGTVTTITDGEIWFVHAVFVNVTTDFDCTGDDTTLVVGDGVDPNGFVDLADAELQVADTEQTGSPAGWQGLVAATMGTYLDGAVSSAPHIYAPSGSDETIDWLVDEASGESISAGAATIYVVYTRIQ
jgi:hypothetical protein